MSGVSTFATADGRAAQRRTARDVLVIAALLIVAVLPALPELGGAVPLDAPARVQLGWEAQSRRAMGAGELPAWNPYQFGGRPHLADWQTRALYPPHVLVRLLPQHLVLPVSFMLHAWVASLGAYVVARHLRASRVAAFLGSVAVVLSAILSPGEDLTYSPNLFALAWVPPVLALTLRAIDAPRPLTVVGLAAAIVMGVTASPRGPLYVLPGVIAMFAFAALWPSGSAAGRTALFRRLIAVLALSIGLAAYQLVPSAAVPASMAGAGGMRSDHVVTGSWHSPVQRPFEIQEPFARRLRSLRGGRVLAACDSAIDPSQLLGAGVPAVGGYGGVFAADYARFVNIALGGYPEKPTEYAGVASAGGHPARPDLLQFLNAGYLVSCASPDPDRWQLVDRAGDVGLYRTARTLPRAFWTCAPEPAGRQQIEYRLRRYRYDETLTLQPGGPVINVRWAPEVDDPERARLETAFHIAPERFLGERTWQYELLDPAPANVAAIVTSPDVEDTSGIDRSSLAVVAPPPPAFDDEPKDEWLLGAAPCEPPKAASVLRDDADGDLVLAVNAPRDGVVFVSETFYDTRRAFVDGRRVEPLNVNLAFVAVPVPAGIHRVELRHDGRVMAAGMGISGATFVASMLWAWRARSRR